MLHSNTVSTNCFYTLHIIMAIQRHEGKRKYFECAVCGKKLTPELTWWRRNKQSKKPLPFCESCLTSNGKKRFKVYENELSSHTILRKDLALILVPKNRSTQPKRKHFYVDCCQLVRSEKVGRNGKFVYYWRPIAKFYQPVSFDRMLNYIYYCRKCEKGSNIFKFRQLVEIEPRRFRLVNIRVPFGNKKGHFSLSKQILKF